MNILMVCLGNICRSPLAEGVMQHLIDQKGLNWTVDSAGTSGFHNGALPDMRSIAVAKDYGIDITNQHSRKFVSEDFDRFDHIYVMDSSNYQNVVKLARSDDHRSKVSLLLNAAEPGLNRNVPDPYYEGGFDGVYQMIDKACKALVSQAQVSM